MIHKISENNTIEWNFEIRKKKRQKETGWETKENLREKLLGTKINDQLKEFEAWEF